MTAESKQQPTPRAPAVGLADEDYEEAAALRETLRTFSRRSETVTRAHGLTPRTYQLLLMVRTARSGRAGASLSELEERLQLGKSTVTELVLRTERRGLVRRELDRSRPRANAIFLTPAGERTLARAVAALGDERSLLFEALETIRP